uniref:Macro domain-containing protein n=1 Tax=Esox lucius TaxID=8010 RepID=A0AAY5L005_ESOLU
MFMIISKISIQQWIFHPSPPFYPFYLVKASPPDGPEHELHLDSYLLRYLKESPGAGRDLQQKLSSLGCSVQLLSEEGRAVVRGSGQAELCRAGVEDGTELGRWKLEVEKLFEQLVDRYKCHYEMDPRKVHTLLQSSTLGSEDVRVYEEGGEGFAVVVGEGSEVQAKLKEIEANLVQHLSSTNQAKIRTVCLLGQAKLRLLGEVIEKDLGEFVPGVKVTRVDSTQLVLEGSANEVRTARQLVTDKTSLVMERVVSGVSPNLLTFLSEAYGRPGSLGSLLGFGSQVQVDLGVTELRLFALSPEKLDQAEKALLGEFGEEMIDVPNCDPLELTSTIEKKVMEMNQHRRRVVARYVPGCRVQLLGHFKEVQELREEIQAFLIDWASARAVGCPQPYQSGLVSEAGINSRWEETVADAIYSLPWGLQVVVRQGDITKEKADALVNAANGDLDHAGGVAAALSRAGGPEVQQASRDLVRQVGRLGTGSVVETTGGKLPCKMLLHAVGPVGGSGNERPLLEKTVKTALDLAETLELQTLAMPCISSGIFGVPLKVCSEAIVSAVRDFGREKRILTKVTLIDVRAEVVKAMQEACDRLLLGRRESSEQKGWSRTTTTVEETSYYLPWGLQVVVRQGDITKEEADALVNAANGDLDHGGGVAAALSRAGGPEVKQASRDLVRKVGRLATGSVVETTGGKLPCKMLLHAVGPVGGRGNERPLLEKTVKTALDLAETLELQTLAMPCISSGIFGVPLKVCSEAIVSAVRDFGREQRILTKVTLIDVRAEVVRAMQEACDRLLLGRKESSEQKGGSRTTTTTTNTSHGDTDTYTRGAVASEGCVQVEIVQGTIEKQQVRVHTFSLFRFYFNLFFNLF